MRLEAGPLLAWVSPCGGLLDFSRLDVPDGPPRPVLRRAVPGPGDPSWLAVEPRLDGAGPPARLLDRSPLSARLALGDPPTVIRYELTGEGLLIGVTPSGAMGRLLVRLDRDTPPGAVEPLEGTPAPEHLSEDELAFGLARPVSLLIRTDAPTT